MLLQQIYGQLRKKLFILSISKVFIFLSFCSFFLFSCSKNQQKSNVRFMKDTIGFTHKHWQIDSMIERINKYRSEEIEELSMLSFSKPWKTLICPHDDHAYVGHIYPFSLKNLKAKTLILFGVAHKAAKFNLENKIVFSTHTQWRLPYGDIYISEIQEDLLKEMNPTHYTINDSLHEQEHSLEASLPFIQHQLPETKIIPILVPYFRKDNLIRISNSFANTLKQILIKRNLTWGDDIAIVISSDAVHYGDQDWGGKNLAPYGADIMSTATATDHDMEIIENTLLGKLTHPRIIDFMKATIDENDFKKYKWTWCGRYSVPFGLMTTYYLNNELHKGKSIRGRFISYTTSHQFPVIPVKDLGMDVTAPANNRHWVGYAAIGYN